MTTLLLLHPRLKKREAGLRPRPTAVTGPMREVESDVDQEEDVEMSGCKKIKHDKKNNETKKTTNFTTFYQTKTNERDEKLQDKK